MSKIINCEISLIFLTLFLFFLLSGVGVRDRLFWNSNSLIMLFYFVILEVLTKGKPCNKEVYKEAGGVTKETKTRKVICS